MFSITKKIIKTNGIKFVSQGNVRFQGVEVTMVGLGCNAKYFLEN